MARLKAFPRHLLQAMPVLLLLSLLMLTFEHFGWLEPLQRASLDMFLRSERKLTPDFLFIVAITDDDYKIHFKESSPLDPCRIVDLVNAVADTGPSVIGVDIDTSSERYVKENCASRLRRHPGTKIIWALVPDETERREEGALHFQEARVLGKAVNSSVNTGIPVFPVDGDGVVRRFEGEYKTDLPSSGGTPLSSRESLARAVAKAYAESTKMDIEFGEGGILQFASQLKKGELNAPPFQVIQADEFLHDPADKKFGKPDWSALKNKAVLIGGTFKAARDRYPTPAGIMAGVELIGHAIDSDLHGGGIREGNTTLAFLLDLLAGSIVVFTYYVLEENYFRWAFWITMIEIPVLAFAGSLLAFRTKAYWFDFVPVVGGMVLHQLYETSKKHRETKEELHEARHRIHELERELKHPHSKGSAQHR